MLDRVQYARRTRSPQNFPVKGETAIRYQPRVSTPSGLRSSLQAGWARHLPGRQETLAQRMVFLSPVPCRTRSLSRVLSSHPRSSPSLRDPVSTPHPGCAAAGTTSPSISTSASSAAMMGPNPIRPPERSRERWKTWGRGRMSHGAELKPRPAPSARGRRGLQRKDRQSTLKFGPSDFCWCVKTLGSCSGLGFEGIALLDQFLVLHFSH